MFKNVLANFHPGSTPLPWSILACRHVKNTLLKRGWMRSVRCHSMKHILLATDLNTVVNTVKEVLRAAISDRYNSLTVHLRAILNR